MKRNHLRGIVMAASLCMVLAACVSSGGLHPTGTLTDPASLKSGRSLANVTLSPTAWPRQDWWVAFGDPQLTRLIGEALASNPTLLTPKLAHDARRPLPTARCGTRSSGRFDCRGGG